MPGKNRYALLGWHADPDIAAYVRGEAQRRGVPIATVLNETMRRGMTGGVFTCPRCQSANRDPLDVREGFCARCGQVTDPVKLAAYERNAG